jgi:adenine-specific DNA-methyltransferase
MYYDDYPVTELTNLWADTRGEMAKAYVVQTAERVVERCMLMSTDPGDLVLDPTCGSGTTAAVAEQWGRRWITIDTSRIALSIARQRLLTSRFDYYRIKQPSSPASGLSLEADPAGGFLYKTVPHITLKSIAQNAALDTVFAKHEPVVQQRLAALNEALISISPMLRSQLESKLAEKERREGKRSITEADRRRWLLPKGGWKEWQVPFDTDEDWPALLRDALVAYREVWRAKMDEVNAVIEANAEQEELVDQPEVVKGVVRVCGPFTVEGVRPEELNIAEEGLFDGTPNEFEPEEHTLAAAAQQQNLHAYLERMVRLIRQDGLTFINNQRRKFSQVERLYDAGTGAVLHAEGAWEGESADTFDVAVGFGPQYGPVTALQVEELIRGSKRHKELIVAGFSFDADATSLIQQYSSNKLRIHQAYIRPDVNPGMDGLLKDTPNSQLFTVFGTPEIEVRKEKDEEGDWIVTLKGVDIYDPVANTVRSTGADKVAAWFLDSDFDGRCFAITQAFFPNQDAWEKIAKALGSSADVDAFEAFKGTVSVPFNAGTHKRVAVKVIDPRGNEVMAVRALEG